MGRDVVSVMGLSAPEYLPLLLKDLMNCLLGTPQRLRCVWTLWGGRRGGLILSSHRGGVVLFARGCGS